MALIQVTGTYCFHLVAVTWTNYCSSLRNESKLIRCTGKYESLDLPLFSIKVRRTTVWAANNRHTVFLDNFYHHIIGYANALFPNFTEFGLINSGSLWLLLLSLLFRKQNMTPTYLSMCNNRWKFKDNRDQKPFTSFKKWKFVTIVYYSTALNSPPNNML